MSTRNVTLLDGAIGTELEARGASIAGLDWSARAIDVAPEILAAIHADYAAAGAEIHAACTYRATPRASGAAWRTRMSRAVAIARAAIKTGKGRIAGSIAPLEDCYRPDLAPDDATCRVEHRAIADALAAEKCDLLLLETFASPREARLATEEAARTGLPTWVSLTAGWDASLMSPEAMSEAARECIAAGAQAVLVNCVPAARTIEWLRAIANPAEKAGVPYGAYANAVGEENVAEYVQHARSWVALGATLVGGCCGTSPAHVAALREIL